MKKVIIKCVNVISFVSAVAIAFILIANIEPSILMRSSNYLGLNTSKPAPVNKAIGIHREGSKNIYYILSYQITQEVMPESAGASYIQGNLLSNLFIIKDNRLLGMMSDKMLNALYNTNGCDLELDVKKTVLSKASSQMLFTKGVTKVTCLSPFLDMKSHSIYLVPKTRFEYPVNKDVCIALIFLDFIFFYFQVWLLGRLTRKKIKVEIAEIIHG